MSVSVNHLVWKVFRFVTQMVCFVVVYFKIARYTGVTPTTNSPVVLYCTRV